MGFNRDQVGLLARYFADLSKILFGSIVIGYFLPSNFGIVNFFTFVSGSGFAAVFVIFSIKLLKTQQ